MTRRFAAVLAGTRTAAPPGVDPAEYRLALLEDTYEVVAGLEFVTPVLALPAPDPDAEAVTWPGTPVLRVAGLGELLSALHDLGAEHAAVVAPDAPDLPGLYLGKLFRALGSGQVAVSPAAGGGPAQPGGRVGGVQVDPGQPGGRGQPARRAPYAPHRAGTGCARPRTSPSSIPAWRAGTAPGRSSPVTDHAAVTSPRRSPRGLWLYARHVTLTLSANVCIVSCIRTHL